jgi:hypothetical protein
VLKLMIASVADHIEIRERSKAQSMFLPPCFRSLPRNRLPPHGAQHLGAALSAHLASYSSNLALLFGRKLLGPGSTPKPA